jgi:mannan endo-1,6-alpha-mannosidase
LAPFTATLIMPKLRSSAQGAAKQCSGGDDGTWCGQNWNSPTWDGFKGAGEQMAALAVIQANMIDKAPKLVTANSGGTPSGEDEWGGQDKLPPKPITPSERTGAAIITALIIMTIMATAWWMVDGD